MAPPPRLPGETFNVAQRSRFCAGLYLGPHTRFFSRLPPVFKLGAPPTGCVRTDLTNRILALIYLRPPHM